MAAVRETQNQRLDRIEEKIDKLSDAMISLARAEEKARAAAGTRAGMRIPGRRREDGAARCAPPPRDARGKRHLRRARRRVGRVARLGLTTTCWCRRN